MANRIEMFIAALGILAVLTLVALATQAAAVTPTKAEKRQARAECRAELRGGTFADFAAEWGRPRPFRRCVRVTSRELARERVQARREAVRTCNQEMNADPVEFKQEYPGPRPLRSCIRQEML